MRARSESSRSPTAARCPTVWSQNLARLVSLLPRPAQPSPRQSSQQLATCYRSALFLELLTGPPALKWYRVRNSDPSATAHTLSFPERGRFPRATWPLRFDGLRSLAGCEALPIHHVDRRQ